jgi:CRP-like cAMP-binding protein
MAKLSANKLIEVGFDRDEVGTIQLYEGRGCPVCKGSGYKGRVGVFELMEATPIVAEAIASQVPEAQLRKIALKEGMATLRQDGLMKVAQGLTTLDQVLEKTVLQKESLPHYLLNPDELVFSHDDIIIKEGNTDTNFYKLIQGSLGVYKGQTQIAEISQTNTFFGEMSALVGGSRSATIRSQGKSIVKMFPGDKLMEVIEGYPDIAKTMMTTLVDRLSATNVRLSTFMHDKAELERTYIAQLTASTSAAGIRPIASAPKRTAAMSQALAGAPPRPAEPGAASGGDGLRSIAGSGTAPRPIAGAGATPRPIAGSGAPVPEAAAPPQTITGLPLAGGAPTSPPSPTPQLRLTPADRTTAISSLPGGAVSQRFNAPDVTRLMAPKSLAAAAPATIRVTTADAPRARIMKSA